MERSDVQELKAFFSGLVPFRFLHSSSIERLARESTVRRYAPGGLIVEQGAAEPDSVFVVLSGSAESLDAARMPVFRINVLESGAVFGERSCVLGLPHGYRVAALDAAALVEIPGDRFRALLLESPAFAQAFAQKLREGRGIFDAFDAFRNDVERAVATGHLEIRKLSESYKRLAPALHPRVADEGAIDFGALDYATRRLPANVERTFVFLLTDDLPVVYTSPELLFEAVASDGRRRYIYDMLAGKDMVLVRSGLSDLVDFVSCLCAFAVEARKIRYRLNHPDLVLAVNGRAKLDRTERGSDDGFFATLPFSADEIAGLKRVWPGETLEKLRSVVFHRQVYSVDIRKQVNNYNRRLSERWIAQVAEAARDLIGASPADLPEDFDVHIVSSNTHSVSNCLNPFFVERGAEIVAWAERGGKRLSGWTNAADEVYHHAREYLKAFPERKSECLEAEKANGIIRLPDAVTTAISVQLMDGRRIASSAVDPGIAVAKRDATSLIVNIDYAFGEQAEEILRNLLVLFGRNVASINVLGKAGALTGSRGDVLVPTAFVEQTNDTFLPVSADHDDGAPARLEAMLPGRRAHRGPLLTVQGTLLQNRPMLNFYRRLWGCVGLEMEGIWYLRALVESEQLGVLKPGAARRFLYYVSDLPLEHTSNLSEPMTPVEGVPPLYAVTRDILSGIFGRRE